MGNKNGNNNGKADSSTNLAKANSSTTTSPRGNGANASNTGGATASNPAANLPTNMGFTNKKYINGEVFVHSNMGTSEIPEQVKELKCTTLILASNDIAEVPDDIGKLVQLRTLDMNTNRVTSITSEISSLVNLNTLNLSNNKLFFYPLTASLASLKNLTTLNLAGNQLEDIPDFFGKLSSLTDLDISENNVKALPDALLDIPLKRFWAPKNGLQSLPQKIGNCRTLQDINFENNKFTKLPDSIGQLQDLKKLNVAFNGVRILPESFSTLGNLQELILSDNPALNYIPEYTNFPHLVILKLRNLQLPCVDPTIQVLSKLRELELRANAHMGAVPDELGKLASLTKLDLYGNKLKIVPAAIGNCLNLEILDLRNNLLTIESMPRQFANLAKLKKNLSR